MTCRFEKIAFCAAIAFVTDAALRADDLALNSNPYAPIVTRNVFNLNAPVVISPDSNPPPKITPNGIMAVFGKLQVLFKVAGSARPGQPAKDQYYTLSEGERQDDIEVMQIDDQKGLITFKNHGVVQTLSLASAPSNGNGTMPLPPSGLPLPVPNAFTPPNPYNGNNNGGRKFGQHGGTRGGPNNQGNNGASTGGDMNLRTVPTRTYQPEQTDLTPEQTAVLIEAQRLKYQQENNPIQHLLPPTPLTPYNTANGEPPAP